MKIQVTMKTPDALDAAICKVLDAQYGEEVSEETDIIDSSEIKDICRKWFRHSELVTLEIDTEKKTCIVKEN